MPFVHVSRHLFRINPCRPYFAIFYNDDYILIVSFIKDMTVLMHEYFAFFKPDLNQADDHG